MATRTKPGKVPAGPPESSPASVSKVSDVHTIPNPLPYLDKLATTEEVGNTPRPSPVQDSFFKGMRLINHNSAKAEKHLVVAVKEAQKALKGPKVPKIDVERMAYACMGLGYACVVKGNVKKAASCYTRSIAFWCKIHGPTSELLIPLMADNLILRILINDKNVKKAIKRLIGLHELAVGNGIRSVENAYALFRIAATASGQRGASMHVPLETGQAKLVIKASLIKKLYDHSVAHLETCGTEGEKNVDKKLYEVLTLFEGFLKATKKVTAAPKATAAPTVESKDGETVEGKDAVEGKDVGGEDVGGKDVVEGKSEDTGTKEDSKDEEKKSEEVDELAIISQKLADLSAKLGVPAPTS